jgi:hypothetical protein
MRKVRTLAIVLLVLMGILTLWKSVDPQETVFRGPRDAIQSINEPAFRSADEVTVSSGYPVIGVALNGEAKAYPVLVLDWHEIVNDEVGGVPIAVTYCPLCGAGVVFDRRVGGSTLTFGVSGLLYKNDLVMYDRQTNSQWIQILGKAIRGPLEGSELTVISSRTIQWGAWLELWPDSEFMEFPAFDQKYGEYPYGDYRDSGEVNFPREYVDDSLPPKEMVLGVGSGEAAVAYPASVLRESRVVNDVIDGTPVVVTYYNDAMAVFLRGNATFSFSEGFYMKEGVSGNRWNMVTGRGEPGSANEGRQLAEMEHVTSYWFVWVDFHPDTQIYGVATGDRRGLGLLESYWAVMLAGAAIVSALLLHDSRWRRERELRSGGWIDLSKSHMYGGAAMVLGGLFLWFSLGDLRWTNALASVALGGSAVALGTYLVMERGKLGRYSVQFTGAGREEASEGLLPSVDAAEAREVGGTTVWPRTPGTAYDLAGERVILVDDWAYAETGGLGMSYLNAALRGEEE